MRIALHSILRRDAVVGYEQNHQAVPASLVESFDRFGIHSWTIWRSGLDLFHVVEADDYQAADALLAGDPANLEWQATIGVFVERFVEGEDEGSPLLHQVWDFETQKRDEQQQHERDVR